MNYANYLPDNKKYLNCSLSCTIDSLPKEIIESLNSAIIADQLTQYPKNEYEEMIETIRKMYNIKSIVPDEKKGEFLKIECKMVS